MDFDPRVIIPGALSLIVVLIILSSPLIDIQEEKTEVRYEPYSYQQSFIRETQTQKFIFPWFTDVTQVQYVVTNTDLQAGTFECNFIFDNGVGASSLTKKENIIAGEDKTVVVDSPLKGKSTVQLNVIPPTKAIPEVQIIDKKVSAWEFLGMSAFDFVLGLR